MEQTHKIEVQALCCDETIEVEVEVTIDKREWPRVADMEFDWYCPSCKKLLPRETRMIIEEMAQHRVEQGGYPTQYDTLDEYYMDHEEV